MKVRMWVKLSLTVLLVGSALAGANQCGGQASEACEAEGDSSGLVQVRSAALPVESLAAPAGDILAKLATILDNSLGSEKRLAKPIKTLLRQMVKALGKWFTNPGELTKAMSKFMLHCEFTHWANATIHKELATWGDEVEIIPHEPKENFSKSVATTGWLYASATNCNMKQLDQWPKSFDSEQCRYLGKDGAYPFVDEQNLTEFATFIDNVTEVLTSWLSSCPGYMTVHDKVKRAVEWAVKRNLERLQGNKNGFVAIDRTLGAVVVSVSGTGMDEVKDGNFTRPADPGWLDDIMADGDFWWNMNGEKTDECTVKGVTLPGYYHPGFCAYYLKMVLYSRYEDLLINHTNANPDLDLFFTGHSLGGAAMTIAAIDAHFRLKLKPKRWLLYTYGSPRAVSPAAASYVNANFNAAWRVTRKYDPVPLSVPCYPTGRVGGAPVGQSACKPVEKGPFHYGTEVYFPYDAFHPKATTPMVAWGKDFPPAYELREGGESATGSAEVPVLDFVCSKTLGVWPLKFMVGFRQLHNVYMNNGPKDFCCAQSYYKGATS